MGMLDGKVAVVTGACGGIGRAEALELARHGAALVVNDVGTSVTGEGADISMSEQLAKEIAVQGGRAVAHSEDVSSFRGARSLVEAALENFGRLDVVVNGAGILRDKMIFNMAEDDWDSVLRVHLKHTYAVSHHACVHWRHKAKAGELTSGRIINTTSGAGLVGNPGQANYGAAKAAIAAFTVIVAQEMHRYGVTVNAISPLARTRMTENAVGVEAAEGGSDPYAPENVAPLVAWLASDDAQWVTGQILRIEGGRIGLYKGWHLANDIRKEGRFEAEELGVVVRRLFGSFPADNRGAAG